MTRMMALLALVTLLGTGCAGIGRSWQEEVMLQDGTRIVVDRGLKLGSRYDQEMGAWNAGPPVRGYTLDIPLPGGKGRARWEHDQSLIPLAVGIKNGIAYLATAPSTCPDFDRYGRPIPAYVFFKFDGGWKRISVDEFPEEIKSVNLLSVSGSPRTERLIADGFISADSAHSYNALYLRAELRTITRNKTTRRYAECIRELENVERYRREKGQ